MQGSTSIVSRVASQSRAFSEPLLEPQVSWLLWAASMAEDKGGDEPALLCGFAQAMWPGLTPIAQIALLKAPSVRAIVYAAAAEFWEPAGPSFAAYSAVLGVACDIAHDRGDEGVERLRELVRDAWGLMSPARRRELLAAPIVKSLISSAVDVDWLSPGSVVDQQEFSNALTLHGFYPLALYSQAQTVEFLNAARLLAAMNRLDQPTLQAALGDGAGD